MDRETLSLESISSRIQFEMSQLLSECKTGKIGVTSPKPERADSVQSDQQGYTLDEDVIDDSLTPEDQAFRRQYPVTYPIHEMLECDPPQIKNATQLIEERIAVLRKRFEAHEREFQRKWTRKERQHAKALQWSIQHRRERLGGM